MCAVPVGGIEVSNGTAVCYDNAVETPLVAEYILEEPVAAAARLAFVPVVSAHHFLYVAVLYDGLESREISFPEITHGYRYVELVPQRLRSAVYCIVLCAGVYLVVFLVVALHCLYGLCSHNCAQVRVLARSFLTASPSGVTEDVHVRAPE